MRVRFKRLVIESVAEKSFLQTNKERARKQKTAAPRRHFRARTSDANRSAIKIEGCASDDDSAKRYQNSAALHYFLRRATISHFSFQISNSSKAFIPNQWTEPPMG